MDHDRRDPADVQILEHPLLGSKEQRDADAPLINEMSYRRRRLVFCSSFTHMFTFLDLDSFCGMTRVFNIFSPRFFSLLCSSCTFFVVFVSYEILFSYVMFSLHRLQQRFGEPGEQSEPPHPEFVGVPIDQEERHEPVHVLEKEES